MNRPDGDAISHSPLDQTFRPRPHSLDLGRHQLQPQPGCQFLRRHPLAVARLTLKQLNDPPVLLRERLHSHPLPASHHRRPGNRHLVHMGRRRRNPHLQAGRVCRTVASGQGLGQLRTCDHPALQHRFG